MAIATCLGLALTKEKKIKKNKRRKGKGMLYSMELYRCSFDRYTYSLLQIHTTIRRYYCLQSVSESTKKTQIVISLPCALTQTDTEQMKIFRQIFDTSSRICPPQRSLSPIVHSPFSRSMEPLIKAKQLPASFAHVLSIKYASKFVFNAWPV